MRVLVVMLLFSACVYGQVSTQDLEVLVRPDVIHVETIGGNLAPMERVFFHVIIHNVAQAPLEILWVRFDFLNPDGIVLSGQYSGKALISLFDNAMERKRIEPTTPGTLILAHDERKAISDIFIDIPSGFVGHELLVEADYRVEGRTGFQKTSAKLKRSGGFQGRLPFDGTWYVASEHGFHDRHKRFVSEAFAYDFVQVGANSKTFQGDGSHNSDYFAYGKKVLAAKEGTVVFVRTDVADNEPGHTNTSIPNGNVVIIDHGAGQYGFYGHLKPGSINVRVGSRINAGEPIGEVGNTGDSTEPHLHVHVMNNAEPARAEGIPLMFQNWKNQSQTLMPSASRSGIPSRGDFIQP